MLGLVNKIMNFRKIMYRAWDLEELTMHYDFPLSSFNGVESSNGKLNRHDKHSVMTWAGNCYEDGKLQKYIMMQSVICDGEVSPKECIYESDIVEFNDVDEMVVGSVHWSDKTLSYCIFSQDNQKYKMFSHVTYKKLGNIFENQNLLCKQERKLNE